MSTGFEKIGPRLVRMLSLSKEDLEALLSLGINYAKGEIKNYEKTLERVKREFVLQKIFPILEKKSC
ncbi:hypothetical protein CM19_07955 [Candidatus Acidianus copahuensis]|uniref:Uncharacterized protein n=1 Tax=Candidatus Acidianus copahuensis TaxID=1160895 RepID=A0A031LN66_9CREN|nr:hypothetical protein [Candidatus Acidianus copahuensis]EZQ04946.1 hypothetical protein CM19_07955 [Candidatus Acidianus copahuensis]